MGKKKSKRSQRKSKTNQKLATLFKMSREELTSRKFSGAGVHKTRRDRPRSEQNRRSIDDQL